MKWPKIALIDADIIAYRVGLWGEVEGSEWMEARMVGDVGKWTPRGCTPILCLSTSRDENWRRDHWPEYKTHRDSNAHIPVEYIDEVKRLMGENFDTRSVPRLEADDLLGIGSSRGAAVAVSVDKDLKGVPGWNWNPDKEFEPTEISVEDASKFFHMQWIMGDTTDSIPGIYRMGPKKSLKYLDEVDDPNRYTDAVLSIYLEKGYDLDYAVNMGVCVRILHDNEWNCGEVVSSMVALGEDLGIK